MPYIGPYQQYTLDGAAGVARIQDWNKQAVAINNGLAQAKNEAVEDANAYTDEREAAAVTAAAAYTDGKNFLPAWRPNTVYATGQQVVAQSGDIVTRKAAGTSAATWAADAANWDGSTQGGRILAVESKNTEQDGRLDKIDAKAPAWDAPRVLVAVVDKDGRPTWLQANDTTGGPTEEAVGAIRDATGYALSDTPGVSVSLTAGGNPTWLQANDTDGGPTPEALSFLTPLLTETVAAAAEPTLPPERNFTISTYDGPRKLRSDQSLIVGRGDSHVQGGAVPSTRWMSILGTTFPAANVVNRGVGGNTTDLVAIRAGAIRPRLTFAGGSIPASGAVDVTFTDPIAYRNTGSFSVTGTVAGVAGTLARTDLYALTFTRTAPGTAVTTGPAEFVSDDYALYAGGVQIICSGRNDVADDVALSNGSVPLSNSIDRAVSAHVAMVESQPSVIKKTLILGTITDVGYVRGTVGYDRVTGINRELQRIYPNYFWDLRGYLVNECIYDLGITPTSADLTAMAGDTLPPSIMLPDNIHFDVPAHAMVAEQVAAQLISRKLVNP